MNHTKKVGLNAIFLALTLIVNALGAFGFINGTTQSDVSNQYFTLITPSGPTFSIWSVIYTLLIISLIVFYVKREDPYYQKALGEITPLFIVSCLLNITWIVLFSFVLVEISTLFIFAYAIVLALICQKLLQLHEKNRWLLPLTFGIYTGWLMIATVVNVAASLVKMGWNGFGIPDEIWAIIILIVAAALVIGVAASVQNAALPLSVAWAYFGIYQNLVNEHTGNQTVLQIISIIGLVVLIGYAGIQFYKNEYRILPKKEAVIE
jgi:hypothetical protein